MKLLLLPIFATYIVVAAHRPECPSEFRIGQNYHEIQSGVCPDIDSIASFITPDSTHSGYLCRSKSVMVVGDRRTRRMDAFFLYNAQ
jgi:hypothetical protein